jgi:DnaK suppressor protein
MATQRPTTGAPYSTEELRPVREALLKRRHDLIEAQAAHDRDMKDEQDRDPATEEEEAAAHQHTQFVSARMREGIDREILQVDRAITRLDSGVYGLCEECDEPIAIERLRVLPFTRLCAIDAAMDERDKMVRSQGHSLTL